MTNDTEPRALGAALSAPAFVTRGHGVAMHAANRHVERWAPEANAGRVRSMRSLGFVDRLVAPWMETAQRSASLRLFSQYAQSGASQREAGAVSWVFPRPWYQDELDWMAAARQTSEEAAVRSSRPLASPSRQVPAMAPTLLTTRGTYVQPATSEIAAPAVVMPSALYEYVAPSLSIAASQRAPIPGLGFGGETQSRGEAYSPLVSLAAVQAADLMSRTVAPLAMQHRGAGAATAMTPGLRSVLTSILERAAVPRLDEAQPTRLSRSAPELVTPPAPRPGDDAATAPGSDAMAASAASASAAQVAEQYAAQRARIVELQRIAQQSAQRELAARAETLARSQAADQTTAAARAPSIAPSPDGRAASDTATAVTAVTAARAAAQAETLAQARTAATTQASQRAELAAAAQAAATAQAATSQVVQSAEVRAEAQRAEAELRQRAGATRATEMQRQAEAATAAAAERARIEQRLAQQTGAQRLHEQARAEAAAHARTPIEPARRADLAASAPAVPQRAAPEVTAAIAGLPPELAAILGSTVAQRPERAMQAITELSETLRTVELLARSSASGAAFEVTRGPRMMMPAGLGGLVNAVDRAQAITERPAMLGGQRPLAPLTQFVVPRPHVDPAQAQSAFAQAQAAQVQAAQAARTRAVRVPALSWLSAAPGSQAIAPTTALGATATAAPAALSHVAWSDRWLARFAGATPQSLDLITATAGAAPALRMQALANAAPGAVFVAPDFLRGDLAADQAVRSDAQARASALAATAAASASGSPAAASPARTSTSAAALAAAAAGVPGMRLINPPPSEPIRRFDDGDETPDDVFAAIAQAAARGRGRGAAPAHPVAPAPVTAAAAVAAFAQGAERQTQADLVAHSAPSAPGAGLSAQLASSPFAPALRHVLPLPASASFDVRALFGAGLGATYLAGLLGSASSELQIGAQLAPTWASWAPAPIGQQLGQTTDSSERIDRVVPAFDAAYVSPEAYMGPEAHEVSEAGTAQQVRVAQGARAALEQRAALAQRAALEPGGSAEARAALEQRAALEPGSSAEARAALEAAVSLEARAALEARDQRQIGELAGAGRAPSPADLAAALAASGDRSATVPLTTLRTALLSWGLTISDDSGSQPGVAQLGPMAFATASPREATQSTTTARMMVDAMTMPMLGDADPDPSPTWAAPGMIAERAHSWSVAQERSSSDLALDFVTPELVLAARVYGLGPAEAAQAARLAIVGAGQLGAMASTVDRTFVDAMAIVREARGSDAERRQRISPPGGDAAGGMTRDLVAPGVARDLVAPDPARDATRELAARDVARAVEETSGAPGQPARAAITTAFPTSDGAIAAAIAPTTPAPVQLPSSGTAFGVDRRSPRGAFLWPQATVAALGMTAAGSDGQLQMSVAALELLAAQVVAEVGTYAALSEADTGARALAGEAAYDVTDAGGERGATARAAAFTAGAIPGGLAAGRDARDLSSGAAAGSAASSTPVSGAAAPGSVAAGTAVPGTAAPGGTEPGEAEVLGAAAAFVPAARRARFDALYVALSQTTAGRSWSPAARAARALALAGRGDDSVVTARERAATAWDVLPVVYPGLGPADAVSETIAAGAAAAAAEVMSASYVAPGEPGAAGAGSRATAGTRGGGSQGAGARTRSAGTRDVVGADVGFGMAERDGGADRPYVTVSPGLAGLSARAGDALASYVAPVAPPSAPVRERRDSQSVGAVLRPPTAAPEYVQTGRSGGRYGGGEVEIPPWFEAAARKMLSDRSDNADGISLAELTLVSAAPASHIAASSRSAPSTAPPSPTSASGAGASSHTPQIDVDKLANDVYRQILVMMDAARARNGEPYL